ncbi:MAG TPA: cyclic nucleotide-binding domain-containing protein [candidate division Zixibacteria bacterium]|nr:cyclic nucleotide-binding domain-containing protein [candidate division Zixibacteria bacterium]
MKPIDLNQSNPALDLFLVQLAGKYTKYLPEQVVFREGDHGNTMLLLLSGSVRVIKKNPSDGSSMIIATRESGEFLGEMALVEASPRFATVVAETECEVLEFSKENFEKIIQKRPSLATRVLRSLSKKLRESDSFRLRELEESNRLLTGLNEELKGLNSFLDQVIEQSPSALFLATSDGTVLRYNKAAAHMFGITKSSSHLSTEIIFAGFHPREFHGSKKETWAGEVKGKRFSQEFPVYLSVTTLKEPDHHTVYLLICQDIGELRAFHRTAADLERFISVHHAVMDISDKVNTLLASIQENVELLLVRLPESQLKQSESVVQGINASSIEMLQAVDDYTLRRSADSDFAFVDLAHVLRTVVESFRTIDAYSAVTFDFTVSEDFPKKLLTKSDLIQSITMSLVQNAAVDMIANRILRDRRIAVNLDRSADESSLLITVTDNGTGEKEEPLPPTVNKRSMLRPSRSAIALQAIKELVENYSGDFWIDTDPGKGKSCHLSFPLRSGQRRA